MMAICVVGGAVVGGFRSFLLEKQKQQQLAEDAPAWQACNCKQSV